jgi:hypothetical protein
MRVVCSNRAGIRHLSAIYGIAVFCVLLALVCPPFDLWSLWLADPELGGVARRAAVVLHQSQHEIGAVPADGLHGAVQFRLFPALLPYPLMWSYVGAVAVFGYVYHLSRSVWVTGVFGSAAWFAASVAWLGYYDSLVVLALLVVAFASPGAATVASLLAPWVDERFCLGFLLALLCRDDWRLLWPSVVVVVGFVVVRLFVLPAGENANPRSYLTNFPLFAASWPYLLVGVLTGWRLATWAVGLAWIQRPVLILPTLGVVALGVGTAQDSSRAMMLIAPVVLLGLFRMVDQVRAIRWPLFAVALLLPALLVVDRSVNWVNTWRGQRVMPDTEERIQLRKFWRETYGDWRPF